MHRTLLLVALACSPRTEPTTPEPPIAKQPAPPEQRVADAGVVSGTVDAAALAFRPFTPPEPIATPGPATPQTKPCRTSGAADVTHERTRVLAALDAQLRKEGGMLLPRQQLGFGEVRGQQTIGDVIRGRNNERFIAVMIASVCGPIDVPLVGMDAKHEVFIVQPDPKPKAKRTVALCDAVCDGGCGAEPPPSTIAVEVPEGARFVGGRAVSFPIDVQVALVANDKQGRPKQCPAAP